MILLRSKAWFQQIDARSPSLLRARVLLSARQTDRSGIFIGCKGRRFTIHKSVYSAQVVLPRFLHPGYIHYPFRGLSKGGHWHAFSLSLSSSLECLWDLQVTLPVTPRKLGLTTLTGPNCFLPAIRPWPTLHTVVLEKFRDIARGTALQFHRKILTYFSTHWLENSLQLYNYL